MVQQGKDLTKGRDASAGSMSSRGVLQRLTKRGACQRLKNAVLEFAASPA